MIERPDSPLVARLHASPNIEPRRGVAKPDMLVLHYTGMKSCRRAVDWLSRPESRVSCHYVIDTDGEITQMVAEADRAWHAGVSAWAGHTDINSRSIGFEIHNPGHDDGYPDFPECQMAAVASLARDVIGRQSIPPERVLAHSDVAPQRKIDPGEKFDWARLAAAGVGHWVSPVRHDPGDAGIRPGTSSRVVAAAQSLLASYGYDVPRSAELDPATVKVVAAFQRHFRPERVDGHIDTSTLATLEALIASLGSRSCPVD
ncbi:MAG: N-acetylmuramoyl-L-alanine amidase [Hyphomicrobiaceae bacterium]|nr:N-acetylmuramoyl-L-alanine amidase [Hyphomicrobiaceae bacterium]